jgi:hypothetical protein
MLHAARSAVRAEFAEKGVDRVDYVAALPDPDVWVWLGTQTDAQRDALVTANNLLLQVRRVLAQEVVGIDITGVTVQSDETVNRDYQGSWFYAMR